MKMYNMIELGSVLKHLTDIIDYELNIAFKGDKLVFNLFGDDVLVTKDQFNVTDVNGVIRSIKLENYDAVMNYTSVKVMQHRDIESTIFNCNFNQLYKEKQIHIIKLCSTKYRNYEHQQLIDYVLSFSDKPIVIDYQTNINVKLIKDIFKITRQNMLTYSIINARRELAEA